jgi:hypothetical protein
MPRPSAPRSCSLLLLLWAASADAEDAPPAQEPAAAPEPAVVAPPPNPNDWISLDLPADFGSALDGPAPASLLPDDPTRLEDILPLPVPMASFTGRFSFRPRLTALGIASDDGGWGMAAGGAIGHQWWTLWERPLRPVGQTQLSVMGAFGDARGLVASATTTVGLWAGPVGALVGPRLGLDSLRFAAGADLPLAWTVGPELRLAGQLGPLTPFLTGAPLWVLGDGREGLGATWDEFAAGGGLDLDRAPFGLRLGGEWRNTVAGPRWEASLGLTLSLL